MTVYVLLRGWDYEGERLIDVFETADAAKAEAERLNTKEGNFPETLTWEVFGESFSADICNGDWTVCKNEVRR